MNTYIERIMKTNVDTGMKTKMKTEMNNGMNTVMKTKHEHLENCNGN